MLLKTIGGEIMRRLIKAVITGQPLANCSTIEDKGSTHEIRKVAEVLVAGLKRKY